MSPAAPLQTNLHLLACGPASGGMLHAGRVDAAGLAPAAEYFEEVAP